jgi:hypothetical protein
MKTTHIVTLIDASQHKWGQDHIVKSTPVQCLEHAHNVARAWMNETSNVNHQVFISEVIETQSREATVKVSKP